MRKSENSLDSFCINFCPKKYMPELTAASVDFTRFDIFIFPITVYTVLLPILELLFKASAAFSCMPILSLMEIPSVVYFRRSKKKWRSWPGFWPLYEAFLVHTLLPVPPRFRNGVLSLEAP